MISNALVEDMKHWRRHLHAHPEFGFEEHKTAAFIAEKLRAFGIEDVVEGVGKTGVVATISRGTSNRAIGFRADMDALRLSETTSLPYRSQNDGVMHACGHDGHVAMLLGAAKSLAADMTFDGTIRFIFQPAEEWGKGMLAMMDDGLLDRFPIAEIYGLHNMPGIPVGQFATRTGALMAAEDTFEIKIAGLGGHASRPHESRDALLAACATVTALQAIVARHIDPAELAVVSVTEVSSDGVRNALASNAEISGDCRSYSPDVSQKIEAAMRNIAKATADGHGCTADVTYNREFVPLINDADCTAFAVAVASELGATDANTTAIGASEDFAQILNDVPGNFMFLGNGDSKPLHNSGYDFNDEILRSGAGYFTSLARNRLGGATAD